MKKVLFALVVSLCFSTRAQEVTVAEPDFVDETLMLISKSEGILLKRENGRIKAKAGASLYLTGIGKIKVRITLEGANSINNKIKGNSTTLLVIKAKDHETDPNSFVSIFKFDIYRKKERRFQVAESGTMSKTEINNLSVIGFDAEKYGKQSYLICLKDLTPGEYGIILGDPNTITDKELFKVTTFTVEESDSDNVKTNKQN